MTTTDLRVKFSDEIGLQLETVIDGVREKIHPSVKDLYITWLEGKILNNEQKRNTPKTGK